MKRSIETKIRLNAIFIYLLVALTCGGGFFYFYISLRNVDLKKANIEEYNTELTKINELIYSINHAQTEVNLYIITERKKHLREFQRQAKEISLCIDTLRITHEDLEVDTILTEITDLLRRKELSIIRLNRQFSHRNPIDSLSQSLSAFSSTSQIQQIEESDSLLIEDITEMEEKPAKKSLIKRLTGIFSSSKKDKVAEVVPIETIDTITVIQKDTLPISQIIKQARVNYDQHISAIENQINSLILADQYISFRITELVTMLYNKVIESRIEEINEDEILLRKNNMRAIVVGGIALLLILLSIITILHNANKGYSARKALESANKRTRQLMEGRHKLLLSVSHDVKTPLNSMLGYIDIYKRNGLLTTDEIAPIFNSGNHILALLNNMLEFSSLEKGSVALVPKNFSPQELCNELCEMFMPLAKKKALGFDFHADFEPDLMLYSDCLKIKQILTNILSNAVKYTIEQGITFEATYKKDTLEFRVIDTGVGIPAEKQEQLFKPFSRVEENSVLDEGSGLGLFVVKGLVELFKGNINFKTQQGKGTQITIQLPVLKGEKQQTEPVAQKILIVDDDDVFLDMLSRLCQQLNHVVTTCKTQSEFMKEVQHIDSYNCVLTDLEMGNFSGEEVLKKIREHNKKIPVILITGKTDYSLGMILSEGFTDYLPKPITLHALHALIGGKIEEVKTSNIADFFDKDDKQDITDIMEHFFMATIDNILLLRNTIKEQNFEKAQYLCHKMLPMFLQTGASENITDTLKQIDSMREERKPGNQVWEQLTTLVDDIEKFLEGVQQKYLSD